MNIELRMSDVSIITMIMPCYQTMHGTKLCTHGEAWYNCCWPSPAGSGVDLAVRLVQGTRPARACDLRSEDNKKNEMIRLSLMHLIASKEM